MLVTMVSFVGFVGLIRVVDARRDEHSAILLDLVHLSDLLARYDAAATAVVSGPAPSPRLSDLQETGNSVSDRIRYLERLGFPRNRSSRLRRAFDRYQADVGAARTLRSSSSSLATDLAALRAQIDKDESDEKSAFARYDQTVDTATAIVLSIVPVEAAIALVGLQRWAARVKESPPPSAQDEGPPRRR